MTERPVAPERLVQKEDGNFVLYVSNQSIERPNVDVIVSIDGKLAVAGKFPVEDQHNWKEFTFELPAGMHELRATSRFGETELVETFETGKRNWAVVDYWCCDVHAREPKFTFWPSDRPIGFA